MKKLANGKAKRESVAERAAHGLTELADRLEDGRPFTGHRVTLAPSPASTETVKSTRAELGASQSIFAAFLGISVKTVRAWEQGTLEPNGMARRFLEEIRFDPPRWRHRLRSAAAKAARP